MCAFILSPHSNLPRPLALSASTTARTSWLRSLRHHQHGVARRPPPPRPACPPPPAAARPPAPRSPSQSTSTAPCPTTTFPPRRRGRTSGSAAKLAHVGPAEVARHHGDVRRLLHHPVVDGDRRAASGNASSAPRRRCGCRRRGAARSSTVGSSGMCCGEWPRSIARARKTKMPPFHRYSPDARYPVAVARSGFSTKAFTRAAPPVERARPPGCSRSRSPGACGLMPMVTRSPPCATARRAARARPEARARPRRGGPRGAPRARPSGSRAARAGSPGRWPGAVLRAMRLHQDVRRGQAASPAARTARACTGPQTT